MSTSQLVHAMRATRRDFRSASQWLADAQRSPALTAALRALFGSRLPHHQRLGCWLKEHCGPYDDVALVRMYDGHRKGWLYAVETQAESAARDHEEEQAEQRRITIEAEREQRAITRALKAADKKEAEEREQAELEALGEGPTIQVVQPPPPPAAEPAQGDVVSDPDGQRYLIGRTTTDEQGRTTTERIPLPPPKSEAPRSAAAEIVNPYMPAPAQPVRTDVSPWAARGELQARDKAEWLAWVHRFDHQPVRVESCMPADAEPLTGFRLDPWQSNGVRTAPSEELIGPWGSGWRSVGPHPNWNWKQSL